MIEWATLAEGVSPHGVDNRFVSRYLVADGEVYSRIRSRAASVFDLESRFPRVVCLIRDWRAYFFEDADIRSADGWSHIREMARLHGDGEVDLLALDPDPDTYFHRHFGLWQAYELSVEVGSDDYWAALSEGPSGTEGDEVESLLHHGFTWVAVGASGAWGFWTDLRMEVSVAFSAPSSTLDAWVNEATPVLRTSDEAEAIMSLPFESRALPPDVLQAFRETFPPDRTGSSGGHR